MKLKKIFFHLILLLPLSALRLKNRISVDGMLTIGDLFAEGVVSCAKIPLELDSGLNYFTREDISSAILQSVPAFNTAAIEGRGIEVFKRSLKLAEVRPAAEFDELVPMYDESEADEVKTFTFDATWAGSSKIPAGTKVMMSQTIAGGSRVDIYGVLTADFLVRRGGVIKIKVRPTDKLLLESAGIQNVVFR